MKLYARRNFKPDVSLTNILGNSTRGFYQHWVTGVSNSLPSSSTNTSNTPLTPLTPLSEFMRKLVIRAPQAKK